MNSEFAGDFLVLAFRADLVVHWLPRDPGEDLTIEGIEYYSVVDSDLTAFFDRMIDGTGKLVGFEFLPLTAESSLLEELPRLTYVQLTADAKRLRLYLNDNPPADLLVLDDQAFGGRIYRAHSGEWAISIQTDWLSTLELDTIRAYHLPS